MGQFVGEQTLALRAGRGVLALGEINVASGRVSFGMKRRRGIRRFLIGVNPDVVEVCAEFRFHECLGPFFQLFPARLAVIRRDERGRIGDHSFD